MGKKRAEMVGPKAGAKPKGKGGGRTGRPVKAEGPKHNALSIRGATEGRDWLTCLSDHCRLKTADVIDRALIVYAGQEGFNGPLPKR
jgi:hypothetical protein